MARRTNRRKFLQTTAAIGAGYWALGGIAPRESRSAIEKIQLRLRSASAARAPATRRTRAGRATMVAICDIDDKQPELRRRPAGPKAKKYQRLPQDVRRDGQEHRRRHRQHARPLPRRRRRDGHEDGQARLRAKADDQVALRSPRPRRARRREEASPRRWATRARPTTTCAKRPRSSRRGALGTVKEVHVWTNRPVWPQGHRPPDRHARSARQRSLGRIHRPGGDAALSPGLSPVQVARLVGVRHRRAGRYGLPHAQHAVHGPGPARSDQRAGRRPRATTGRRIPSWSIIDCQFPRARNEPGRAARSSGTTAASGRKPPSSRRPKKSASAGRRTTRPKSDMRDDAWSAAASSLGDKGWLLSPGDYAGDGLYLPEPELPKVDFARFARPLRGMGPRRSRVASRPCRTSRTTPAA